MLKLQQESGIEFVKKWVRQNHDQGKTDAQIAGTTFIYGDEVLTLSQAANGQLQIDSKHGRVVIFRKIADHDQPNVCRVCRTEHQSLKEAIECCTNIE